MKKLEVCPHQIHVVKLVTWCNAPVSYNALNGDTHDELSTDSRLVTNSESDQIWSQSALLFLSYGEQKGDTVKLNFDLLDQ